MIYDDSWLFQNAFGWFMSPSTIWFSRASCSSRSCRCVWHWDDISYPRRLETKDIAWEVYIHAHLMNGPWIFIIHIYPTCWMGRGYTEFCSCHPRPAADLPAPKAGGGMISKVVAYTLIHTPISWTCKSWYWQNPSRNQSIINSWLIELFLILVFFVFFCLGFLVRPAKDPKRCLPASRHQAIDLYISCHQGNQAQASSREHHFYDATSLMKCEDPKKGSRIKMFM